MRSTEDTMKCIGVIMMAILFATLLTAGTASAASWPQKGSVITYYMPSGAGGGSDIAARTFQPFLEAELGCKIVVLVKPGGAGQVGTTEFLSKAGTDGNTILQAVQMNTVAVYLDPERKTPYGRKDLQLVANFAVSPIAVAVKKDSPYKTLKDLIEAARANPSKLKATVSGPMNLGDMGLFMLERAAKVKFAHVIYDNAGEQRAALLGGHVDAEVNPVSEVAPGQKSGEIVPLAVLDSEPSQFLPGIKTAEQLGYKVYMSGGWTLVYKMGTSMDIVNALAAAVQRAMAKPECVQMFTKMGMDKRVLVGKALQDYWNDTEEIVQTVYDDVKKTAKK